MTNLFQNMCLAKDKRYGTGDSLAKLWCHECRRVLADRLITIDETKIIDDMIGECHADHLKKQGVSADVLLNDEEHANIFTTFTATGAGRRLPTDRRPGAAVQSFGSEVGRVQ